MGIDLMWVLVFVTIGRQNHEHGITLGGVASTFWPFGTGLLLGWAFLTLTHRSFTTRKSGAYLALLVVSSGMLLRIISGQGIALSFVIVTLIFLSFFLIGWREIFTRVASK